VEIKEMSLEQTVGGLIAVSTSVKDLKQWRKNCTAKGFPDLADKALRRLIEIGAEGEALPGSVEYDFWKTIMVFEQVLSEENGKTTRLSRTRQKLKRVGVVQTLSDFATKSQPTEGFRMLLERGLLDLTGEALILRHSDAFSAEVVSAAKKRLQNPDAITLL
jgi:hypothetical protein